MGTLYTVICAKTAEQIETPFRLWPRMGPRNHVFDRVQQFFLGGKEETIVKYKDFLQSAVRESTNRSIYRLDCGVGWAEGRISSIVFARWRQCAHMERHVGGTWRIRLNRPSAAAMWSYVILF